MNYNQYINNNGMNSGNYPFHYNSTIGYTNMMFQGNNNGPMNNHIPPYVNIPFVAQGPGVSNYAAVPNDLNIPPYANGPYMAQGPSAPVAPYAVAAAVAYQSDDDSVRSEYSSRPMPWDYPHWIPHDPSGKQTSPNRIRGELQRYIDACLAGE